jgi:hypothetical protein
VLAAAQTAGADATTLIIASQFLNTGDVGGLPDNLLYWSGAFWRFGNRSVNGRRISSYEVLGDSGLNDGLEHSPVSMKMEKQSRGRSEDGELLVRCYYPEGKTYGVRG